MDIEKLWAKAQEKTEIIRGRAKGLSTFHSTSVPYIFLGESVVNEGNTVVRKGKILVEKPFIFLPENMPQFEGFDFEEDLKIEQGALQVFFMMRGIRFPSMKYNNTMMTLDLDEVSLAKSAQKHKKQLEKRENVNTALILGPEDCWQLSILIYMASLVGRCAKNDIINIMEKFQGDS
ncbi:MAG: hypothetical protein ABIH74_00425 [Candidatus Omnitrophota bacterium]